MGCAAISIQDDKLKKKSTPNKFKDEDLELERERKLIESNIQMRNKVLGKKGMLFNDLSDIEIEERNKRIKELKKSWKPLEANSNEVILNNGKKIKINLKLPKLIFEKGKICARTASGVNYNILSPTYKLVEYRNED